MAVAYWRERDPFHPVICIAPMIGYLFFFMPALFYVRGDLEEYKPSIDQVAYAQSIFFWCTAAFFTGALKPKIGLRKPRANLRRFRVSSADARKLLGISYALAGVGLLAYLFLLSLRGGFLQAYSTGKGGAGGAPSGYIGEAVLLGIPAVMFYVMSRSRHSFTLAQVLTAVAMISPILIQGILGGRRGPTFLAMATLGVSWYLARGKRPPIHLVVPALALAGLLMFFLVSQRKDIYIGSDFEFDREAYTERMIPQGFAPYHTTVTAWDHIIATKEFDRYYWGRRYVTQLLVRPIPRQIWPTKYEDMGLEWMVSRSGFGAFTESEWLRSVGHVPQHGSAVGFMADAYMEFWWGCVMVCFLAGYLYAWLWRKCCLQSGVWVIIYLEAAAVSIYLPSQGLVSAWLYRLLFLAVPTWFIWRWAGLPTRSKPDRKYVLIPQIGGGETFDGVEHPIA